MKKIKIPVTVTFHGTVEVSEATYELLKNKGGSADVQDVDLPWDDVLNLDGDVDLTE